MSELYRESLDRAMQAISRATSPRAKELQRLASFVEGTQYAGLPNFFVDDNSVPLWNRAPCVVSPIVRDAVQANQDMLFGEGRFPSVRFSGDEEGEKGKEAAKLLKSSRFRKTCREVFSTAQGQKSAAAILRWRKGKLVWETVEAAKAEPEYDDDGQLVRLVIEYPYTKTITVKGDRIVEAYLYRREIDETSDTTFFPRRLDSEDLLRPDPSQTYDHGFDRCPVVWYAHMQTCNIAGDFDGVAVHENLLDEIIGYDLALSQTHRAALFSGDPQWVEIGVASGYNATEPVENLTVAPGSAKGGEITETNRQLGSYRIPRTRKARKKGPGTIWQYPDPATKVELIPMPPGALEGLERHSDNLKNLINDGLGVVCLGPKEIAEFGKLSGRALDSVHEKHRNRCDIYREDFEDNFLAPALDLLFSAAGVEHEEFEICWGPYTKPDPAEQKAMAEVVAEIAKIQPRILTQEAAVHMLRGILQVDNVEEYLEELEDEDEDEDEEDAADDTEIPARAIVPA